MSSSVLLYSGGMDSHIAWEYLDRPTTLYVDLGHKYSTNEQAVVERLIPSTTLLALPAIGPTEKSDAEIPARNLLLATVAAMFGARTIWISIQKHELSIPDRSPTFLQSVSDLLTTLVGEPVVFSSPFLNMDKVEMVRWYLQKGHDIASLKRTWACYKPDKDGPCANCPACIRRLIAMRLNGIEEAWHAAALHSPTALTYLEDAKNNKWHPDRCATTIAALGE